MIEFQGACGKKISINPVHVEYVQESEFMGKICTLICFDSGKKVFVRNPYAYVVDVIERGLSYGKGEFVDPPTIKIMGSSRDKAICDDLNDDEKAEVDKIVNKMMGRA